MPLVSPRVAVLLVLATLSGACTRAVPAEPSSPPPQATPPGLPAEAAATAPPPATVQHAATGSGATEPAVETGAGVIVAIGDVHGDLASAQQALQLAGAVDAAGNWIGGQLTVVQVGDQTDRGDDEREILDWFERLETQAAQSGGAFWWLLGNHEVMNAQLDLRYVTADGMADFADVTCAPTDTQCAAAPVEVRGRVAAFSPGGPYALRLADQPVVLRLGRTAFVHGGLEPHVAQQGIEAINSAVSAWLRGEAPEPGVASGEDSPLWSRRFATEPTPDDCAALAQTLALLDVDRMVVGHTVQQAGISSACDATIWRIDVGLADLYGGPTQVLRIVGDWVEVVR